MNDINRIGTNIKKYRMQHKYTQSTLADKCHVALQTISCIECGIRYPSLELLIDIADALHTTVNQLLSTEEMSESERWISAITGTIDNYENSNELYSVIVKITETTCSHFGRKKIRGR